MMLIMKPLFLQGLQRLYVEICCSRRTNLVDLLIASDRSHGAKWAKHYRSVQISSYTAVCSDDITAIDVQ